MGHLKEQGEGYWKHAWHAVKFSYVLLILSIVCLIHAIIPNVFVTTASCRLEKLVSEMKRYNGDCDD